MVTQAWTPGSSTGKHRRSTMIRISSWKPQPKKWVRQSGPIGSGQDVVDQSCCCSGERDEFVCSPLLDGAQYLIAQSLRLSLSIFRMPIPLPRKEKTK